MIKKFIIAAAVLLSVFMIWSLKGKPKPEVNLSLTPFQTPESEENIQVLASNLEIPWEIVFLPDNRMLLTERPGRVLLIGEKNERYEIKEVAHIGEGGLLGMVLDPNFAKNDFLYLYFTYQEGGRTLNRVERFTFKNDSLVSDKVIIEAIPGSNNHDGGRIKFGPDGRLYITTGDAQDQNSAQDLNSLAGKILRVNSDGTIPADNPFSGSAVYSYGHRNPQGLAWDENGTLWITEHGPSGVGSNCCRDEVNRIQKGSNYGWPLIKGDQKKDGMESPQINSGNDTWAPSGATIVEDKLYFAGLAGRAIYTFGLKTREFKKYFEGDYGRIRSISLGPDGAFYLITSNRDGRNTSPNSSDDRLIKISPDLFN